MIEKDYTLLRPFDLEKAKAGEPICRRIGEPREPRNYVVGPDSDGYIVTNKGDSEKVIYVMSHTSQYCMAPLCWVEGKPVYKGDVLYSTKTIGVYDAPFALTTSKSDSRGVYGNASFGEVVLNFEHLTWTPPKVKKEGWVNVYPAGYVSNMYITKKDADTVADSTRLSCAKIEWEEQP